MKSGLVAFGALLLTASVVVGLIVMAPGAPKAPAKPERPAEPPSEGPPVSKTGPHPKAVVAEKEYKFGLMAVGESRSHAFVIENKGKAPLTLVRGRTTCKCTMSALKGDKVPPGEKAEVELTWEAKERSPSFRQAATILTDDPDNTTIDLAIVGEVIESVVLSPPNPWQAGEVPEDKPTTLNGQIASRLHEKFTITGVETDNPDVKAEYEAFSEDEAAERSIKAGYRLKVEIGPNITVGAFRARVTLKTEAPANKEGQPPVKSDHLVHVEGTRAGPIQFQPAPGTSWQPEIMAVDLGRYEAAVGTKSRLMLFVTGMGDETMKIVKEDSDTPFLKVSLVRDPNFKSPTKHRYDLIFEAAPGGPVVTKFRKDSARIRLHTNHPKAAELAFRVELQAD